MTRKNPLLQHSLAAIGAVTALATATLAIGAPAHAATVRPSATAPFNYVAMGDSYSAGSGLLPLSPGVNPLCLQSTLNYAHLIASSQKYNLKDVTCGGADTSNFTSAQYPIVTPPQLNALSSSTQLVTMTIGGNDSDVFLDTILECGSAGIATLGTGDPCKTLYGSKFVDTINTSTYPNVVKALQEVRAKAPNARIAIGGYPRILPASGSGCFPQMPIASGDLAYVNDIETALNSAIQRAAAKVGVTYVDMTGVSTGHDACQAVGTRWVEPALFATQFVPVHPNALGEQAYARAFEAALGL
ncbi:SGNH/GDSL hydrolase family protein [Rudaeicoccus suwonensis]|uniref:GDSL-like lipase/acylhydrolase family protein n=1 Tax=Rudaeicoccus suwonensis TaxID=657409 RepID=A0A561E2X8_9MICO|nr:SGNH/GDSL hydrolase family protein [Rudaeicoccus suwonensis]TWE09963.1 GDSL-like lipase/acylhydrolase family protein [Rudaeicoccus suwonensis]